MQPKFSKELEEHLVIRYASLRYKLQTALQDPNEHKNLPQLSFSLLAMLKNVEHVKPHAEYAIESLENTDLKLRAINFLLKGQTEHKSKEGAKLSLKSTLSTDAYFKDKIEKMKAGSVSVIKKPTVAAVGNAQSEIIEEPAANKGKPLVRNFQSFEENTKSDFQMIQKKVKVNEENRNDMFFQTARNNVKQFEEKEEQSAKAGGDLPGFTTAKDQLIKNQQKKGNNNNNDYGDDGYSKQNSYYKKGFNNNNNKYSKFGQNDDMEFDGYEGGGYKGGKQNFYQNKKNMNTGKYGNRMEEDGGYETNNRFGANKGYGDNNNFYGRNNNKPVENEPSSSLIEKVHFSAFRKNLTGDQGGSTMKNPTLNLEDSGPNLGQPKGAGLRKKFVPPLKENQNGGGSSLHKQNSNENNDKIQDERYKGLDPKLVEMIENDIVDRTPKVGWKDIAGLQFAKKTIYEIIVWPMMRPDIFSGLRAPPKGLLLFGPPGTGKTMIGKAIASESNSTFFSISASSLTSKWVGEGEKMVKTLFAIAAIKQPSVIFIDEIDSLLSARSDKDEESSRRIKTEFLVQLDGARTTGEERILIIGATNRPQELDEAVRRRFQKRLYIPLPNSEARRELVKTIIESDSAKGNKYDICEEELEKIVLLTKGYSGADMRNLCAEASMVPLRNIHDISEINADNLRATGSADFLEAIKFVKASVSNRDLGTYLDWNRTFGSFDFKEADLES